MKPNQSPKPHHGRNLKFFREIQGMKQEALSLVLGEGYSQQWISKLESKETISSEVLEKVGKALKVSPEIIKDFNAEGLLNCFNTLHQSTPEEYPNRLSSEPYDKIIEMYEEKIALLERLLESEKEKVEILRGR